MAYSKRTWVARQGTGLNKFRIGDDPTPKELINAPDNVSVQGDALSATNLNDLENRIEAGINERLPKSGGTMTGQLIMNGASAIGTPQGRNIYAGLSDMSAGVTALATGSIYFMYE